MTAQADTYLKRANDFEEKARFASEASEQVGYLALAKVYRQLADFMNKRALGGEGSKTVVRGQNKEPPV